MEAVMFETDIKNHVIEIPEQYWGVVDSPAIVTITADVRRTAHIIPRTKKGPATLEDLGKPFIHTNGWKFNRDEANER
jgi:hypothetical protein